MRPFSIVNDIDLRNVIQHTISLGKTSKLRNYACFVCYIKKYIIGAKYGNVDVNSILPGRTAVTEYSKIMADIQRAKLKSSFIELQIYK